MPGNFHSIPESVIASWPTPNYVDPVERTWLPAMVGVLVGVSTVLLAARFYLRVRSLAGTWGWDDLFIFVGWLFSIGFATCAILGQGRYYLRVHTWDVPVTVFVATARNAFIAQLLFVVSTCATKASILLFYRRMAKDTYDPRWRYAIWAALGFTAAYFVVVLVTYLLICQPLNAYWLSYDFHYDKPYTCLDGDILSPLVGGLSIFSDVYATVLPWVMLHYYDLDIPMRQKVALNIIFSLSLIVAGCGGGRLYYLWKINHTYDTSWVGYDLFVWSLLECHLAVIFACAPAMRAFFRRYLSDHLTRTFGSGIRSARNQTKESQHSSTVRNSEQYTANLVKAATADIAELAAPDRGAVGAEFDSWSRRSSDAAQIATAEDYEMHNLKTLRRHGYQPSMSGLARSASQSTRDTDMFHAKTWYAE